MTADIAPPLRAAAERPSAPHRAAGPERDAGAAPPPPAAPPATPNPRLRLDGRLGMVVIEFRDTAGDVANTIPSPRQMAAYRAALVSDAPAPPGMRLDAPQDQPAAPHPPGRPPRAEAAS